MDDLKNTLYTAMRLDFLYIDRYNFQRGWVYPERYIPYCMIRLIEKGDALFMIDGEEFPVHEGQVVYIPQGCRLFCETSSKSFQFISIRFRLRVQLDEGDFLADYYHIARVTDTLGDRFVSHCFNQTLTAAVSSCRSKLFLIRGNLELIIAWLCEHGDTEKAAIVEKKLSETIKQYKIEDVLQRETIISKRTQDPRINALTDYILTHFDQTLSCSRLAEMVGLSESSMRRLFKKHTGKSPVDFITDSRLTVAARRLLVSNEHIAQIAYSVGIEDPNYFSRLFRENFGISPQEYRRNAE